MRTRFSSTSTLSLKLWDFSGTALTNLLAFILLVAFLFPMVYMLTTAIKEDEQFQDVNSPIWPARRVTFTYQGREYPIYQVPTDQGVKEWALVNRYRQESEFVDPANPEAGLIRWVGNWRALEGVYRPYFTLTNFATIWDVTDYPRLLRNTALLTLISMAGVLIASIAVAYGFSRFRIPGGNVLFIIMIATIMIPEKITLIPSYFIFVRLGALGSWLPLILPHLFGSAVFIFLLRQNFRSIPKDLDEAAMLDGAGPLRILTYIILPQSIPVVVTIALLQFFYMWNETRMAALYLGTNTDLYTLSFAVQNYQSFFPPPNMLQGSALMLMAVPVIVLFLAQRIFMHGVRVTGLEK